MPEFTIDVQFDVYCGKCGAALCPQSRTTDHQRGRNNGRYVEVDPCEKCMEDARDKGWDDGHSEGYDEGKADA